MTFASIPAGTSLFLDANVLVYWFADDPLFGVECKDLIERIESGDLYGSISAALLSDVAHRLMTLEACELFGWPYAGIGRRLRRHPNEIQRLVRFRQALDEIVAVGIRVLDVTNSHVASAGDMSRHYGLLSGDALIVAVMKATGITALASNDTDFNKVPGITLYSPV